MSTANKLTYLNGTKQAIKQAINEDFEVIDDNTTFREYADEISSNNAKYKDLIPKETKNATNTLDISNSSGLDKALVTQYGNTYQETTTGKNKLPFPYTQSSQTQNGVTYTVNSDGTILVNGTASGGNSSFKLYGNYQTTQQLPFPGRYVIGGTNLVRLRVLNNTNNNYTVLATDTGSGTEIDTSTYNTGYIELTIVNGATVNNVLIKPMVVDSLTDTNYEPYTGGNPAPNPDYPQEIVNISGKSTLKDVGKQLFDKSTAEVGKYVTDNGELGSSNNFSASDYIQVVSGNSYTYSGCHMYDTFASGGAYYDENKEFVSSFKMQYSGTITIPQNAKYVRFSMRHAENDEDTFMFEFGTTASTYETYKEQSFDLDLPFELCKIGDYKDRIYPLNGKWYLEKKIDKLVLDGSEEWNSETAYTGYYRYILLTLGALNTNNGLNNRFTQRISQAHGGYEYLFIQTNNGAIHIQLLQSRLSSSSIADFKTWLSNNNVTVYYIATPTTEEITENSYPTLYNQLNNIKLFEGVNHITMTNESGLDVEFDIEYYKDWKLD